MKWFKRRSAPAPAPEPERKRIAAAAIELIGPPRLPEFTPVGAAPRVENPFLPAKPISGVEADALAMDDALADEFDLETHEGIGFFGFAFLAELSQRPEYRRMSETLAKEMTREWIELVSTGDDSESGSFAKRARELKKQYADAVGEGDQDTLDDIRAEWLGLLAEQAEASPKAEKLKAIAAEFKRLKVQDAFRRIAELDGFFGRGQIYIDTGKTEDPAELASPLTVDRRKVRKGALKRLGVVEPIWSYPLDYNSNDPLRADYYKPKSWVVMAKKVHASRLLTFIGRPLPDILKPAYAFSGLSLSQMAKPYVDNWLRTRQSVSDLLHSFNVPVFKTDMSSLLQDGGDGNDLISRVEAFARFKDNRNVLVLQKGIQEGDNGEEFENVTVPLGGLHELQAQAQEQMAAVCGIPLVKLLGITPSGLNASSDGEIRAFYDFIAAFQEQLFRDHLETILKIVQLHLFGEIDPEIGFEFEPLWQLDETAQASARKADADIDCEYFDRGILSAEEIRTKIAADRKSPYASIDVDDVPEAPEGDDEGEGLTGGAGPERDQRSGGEGEAE